MAFVEATQTLDEAAAVPRRVHGPCLLNVVPGGRTPVVSMRDAEEMGYRLAIVPGLILMAMLQAGDAALKLLRESGLPPAAAASVSEVFRRFGADEWNALRSSFATPVGEG